MRFLSDKYTSAFASVIIHDIPDGNRYLYHTRWIERKKKPVSAYQNRDWMTEHIMWK